MYYTGEGWAVLEACPCFHLKHWWVCGLTAPWYWGGKHMESFCVHLILLMYRQMKSIWWQWGLRSIPANTDSLFSSGQRSWLWQGSGPKELYVCLSSGLGWLGFEVPTNNYQSEDFFQEAQEQECPITEQLFLPASRPGPLTLCSAAKFQHRVVRFGGESQGGGGAAVENNSSGFYGLSCSFFLNLLGW